jgi:glycosyltransferase involved in cell wall biosynthesis
VRLLYVTNGFPWPLTSGYLRHYFLLRELAPRHDVTLLSLVGADHTADDVEALAPFVDRVLTFRTASRSRSRVRKALGRARSLLPGADDPASQLGRAAAELVDGVDAVVFSGKRTAPALPALHPVPVVADLCDATSSRIRGGLRYLRPGKLPAAVLDYAQVRRVERRLVAGARHVVFASERDREAVLGTSPGPVAATVIPNGVDTAYWDRGSASLGADDVVFTGAMDYPPNDDAARFLIGEVMPLVRHASPSAHLWVVGRNPGPRLVAAGRAPGVTVTGEVDDVRPYLARAAVFAAPLRFGADIQNKVLDAMAMEVPVVASPVAAGGLRPANGPVPPLVVADGATAVAEAVLAALGAARHDPTPDRAARRFVERHFSWPRSGELLDEVVTRVVAEAVAGSGQGRS